MNNQNFSTELVFERLIAFNFSKITYNIRTSCSFLIMAIFWGNWYFWGDGIVFCSYSIGELDNEGERFAGSFAGVSGIFVGKTDGARKICFILCSLG